MRVSQVNQWKRRVNLLKISTVAIIVTSVLSLAVMLITYFGDNIGNYVVGASRLDNNYALSLSESPNREVEGIETLFAPGIKNLDNITFGFIEKSALTNTQGGTQNIYKGNKGQYFAYTFYLRNESVAAVNYTMGIFLNEAFLNLDAAIRIMVVKDGEIVGIYAKAKTDGSAEDHSYMETSPLWGEGYGYTTTKFIDSDTVAQETFSLAKDAQSCFTVFMWLEGEDAQCIDAVKGGSVKLSMDFTIKR